MGRRRSRQTTQNETALIQVRDDMTWTVMVVVNRLSDSGLIDKVDMG
jgi:hypothetical protein